MQKVIGERHQEALGARSGPKHAGFITYTLACGHTVLRAASRMRGVTMRCYQCRDVVYTCGTCSKPIKSGCYCSDTCRDADG